MSVWLWVLLGVGAAGVLCLLALAVPVDLRFRLVRRERTASRIRVEWLFGLIGKNITGGRERPEKARPEEAERSRSSLRALWHSGLVQRGLRVILRLRRAVSIRELRVRAEVNAGDPAETGMAFALIGPVSAVVSTLPRTDIQVVPDFSDDFGVRGELRGWVRVVPIVALPPLLMFALSPPTWRGVRRLRRAGRS